MAYTVLDTAFGYQYGGNQVSDLIGPANSAVAYTPTRFNIMSTLAPSSIASGTIPLLTPREIQAGAPWYIPPPFNGGCDKPPLSQLLVGFTGTGPGYTSLYPRYPEGITTYSMQRYRG